MRVSVVMEPLNKILRAEDTEDNYPEHWTWEYPGSMEEFLGTWASQVLAVEAYIAATDVYEEEEEEEEEEVLDDAAEAAAYEKRRRRYKSLSKGFQGRVRYTLSTGVFDACIRISPHRTRGYRIRMHAGKRKYRM